MVLCCYHLCTIENWVGLCKKNEKKEMMCTKTWIDLCKKKEKNKGWKKIPNEAKVLF